MSEQIKTALVGYGHLGKWHAQKIAALDEAELTYIVELNPENVSKAKQAHPNCKVVSSLEEIIDHVDSVVIVTPTSTHFALIQIALNHHKHVFCEKPVVSNMEQASKIQEINNRVFQVGHSERCHQAWEILQPEISSIQGKMSLEINRYAPFKGRATDVDVVQDLMIHDIDLMLFLLKRSVLSVQAYGHKNRTDKWDSVTALFTLEEGSFAKITSGRNHVHEVRSFELMHNDGCLFVDLMRNEIKKTLDKPDRNASYVSAQPYEKRDHLLIEHEKFFNSIKHNQSAFVTLEDGKKALFLVDQVISSLDSGKTVEL